MPKNVSKLLLSSEIGLFEKGGGHQTGSYGGGIPPSDGLPPFSNRLISELRWCFETFLSIFSTYMIIPLR